MTHTDRSNTSKTSQHGNTKRRKLLRWLGVLGVTAAAGGRAGPAFAQRRGYDVLVVGAGVFGMWSACHLHKAGKRVAIIDAIGPAHSGASSGGESRVIRCGYGDAEIYTEWSCRSISEWQALSDRGGLPIFHRLGVLWIHRESDALVRATAGTLSRHGIPFERLSAIQLRQRFPIIHADDDEAGFLEPQAGGLMARRAVQALGVELAKDGVVFLEGKVAPIKRSHGEGSALPFVNTRGGGRVEADQFVFACGPWLDQVCPDAMSGRLFVTRQEVFYFAAKAGQTGDLPVWADLPFYGLPSIEGRGFKVANDTHGPHTDPDTMNRRASTQGEKTAREFLARRFPSLAASPLSETRVCQYENSANGDFVIDRHPGLDNVWLAGCGSGHGFKHGPAIGAHVAGLVTGTMQPIERFSLALKPSQQKRSVQ